MRNHALELPGIFASGLMKRCAMCQEIKCVTAFNKNGRRYSSYCTRCQRRCCRAHYRRNKSLHNGRRYERTKASRYSAQLFVKRYLSTKQCVDCGESDVVVLELDHVRGAKLGEISRMIATNRNLEVIRQELQKCEVRCANCHRRKTARQLGWKMRIEDFVGR